MKIDLKKLPRASLSFVEPMLAKLVNHLPTKGHWLYEVKLDGYRALIIKKKRGPVAMFSRRGNTLKRRFPKLPAAFDFLPDGTVIDGEIIALGNDGKPSFSALQNSLRRPNTLYFYVFDLLAYAGKDLRALPLTARRELLQNEVLKDMREPVRLSAAFAVAPKTLIAAARKSGLEGIVAKRANSRYEAGERSGAWVKYKTNKGQELVIGGYKPGSTSFEYLLVGYHEGRSLIFVGKIKNGFTPALRRQVAEHFKKLATKTCPFANLPEPSNARRGEALTAEVMKQIQWLRPKLVAQIEFTDWTKANHLRHSRFAGLRFDKDAKEVVREEHS
jgi:DNA ligase D-like protein (predicted ligase)